MSEMFFFFSLRHVTSSPPLIMQMLFKMFHLFTNETGGKPEVSALTSVYSIRHF